MQYRKWYNKDITTSTLGFGAMRLKVINDEIDEDKGLALIDEAYKSGINYFDTAVPYTDGKNETFVGKALKRYPRDSFYLATKLTIRLYKTKEELEKVIDSQLQNLQTDYIDFYLMHALNKNTFQTIKEWKIMEIVEEWKKAGKIRHIGFSFHDDYETFKEIVDY
ncbi:MAG: aldo/keto reductase, partial [Bacilli bacterium]